MASRRSCMWNLYQMTISRTNMPAPEIAIDYWRLPRDAKLLDVLYAVRSDESTHRFVNHSLANLNQSTDVNPFALREPDMHVKGKKIACVCLPCCISGSCSIIYSFDRSEAEQYVRESHQILQKAIGDESSPARRA